MSDGENRLNKIPYTFDKPDIQKPNKQASTETESNRN